jgi:hypothetical protein
MRDPDQVQTVQILDHKIWGDCWNCHNSARRQRHWLKFFSCNPACSRSGKQISQPWYLHAFSH